MVNTLQAVFEQEVKDIEILITTRFGIYRDPIEFEEKLNAL